MDNPRKSLVVYTLLVLAAAAGGDWVSQLRSPTVSDLGAGADTIIPFVLPTSTGEEWSTRVIHNKVVLFNFWATWCMPCRQEIPSLIKLQEKYQGDIVVLGISMDANGPEVVPDFVHQFDINYPVLYGDGRVANRFGGVTGIPTTFVIDRNFLVKRRYIGFRPHYVFENDIKELL